MPLENGTKIDRYEIRSLLGVGGMGEVYLAFDTKLERNVAIKLLTKSDNKEHLLRFRQEAKAIISLSHPHIVTVYEFGQHEDLHYIVMEYLHGKTLRDAIKNGKTSVSEALEIGIQIANALTSAHATGVIHRDIKPENIIILPDGYIKVLDFGLAKLTREYDSLGNNPEASTASLLQTRSGMIMGTVNYMSPEQLRGKEIDERTDIWSLGVVLFETIGRARPFEGESVGDVIAAVLEHPTPMLADFRPKITEEIEKIVSTSLSKDKADRYQTAHEFSLELKQAKIGIETGTFLFSADTLQQNQVHLVEESSRASINLHEEILSDSENDNLTNSNLTSDLHTKLIKRNQIPWIAVFVLIAVFTGLGFYFFRNTNQNTVTKDWKFKRLTTNGNVVKASISPDGRFIAYTQEDQGKQSLWLKQASETAGTELIKPDLRDYSKLSFAPDGNSIYFVVFDKTPFGQLYRMGILGGSAQKLAENVDSEITFSPDGKVFAFIRSITKEGVNQIIVANADGTEQKVLAARRKPEFYILDNREGLDWSPDGKSIAIAAGKRDADGEHMSVIKIDAESGVESELTEQKWSRVGKVIWSKDGDELYITAVDPDANLYQVVRVHEATGKTSKITNELSDYLNISLSGDDKTLLSVVKDDISNIFLASAENPNQTNQIAKGNRDGANGLRFTPSGKIIYVSLESGNPDIWQMDGDGGNRRQLSFDKAADEYPTISEDGKSIFFVSNRTGVSHIWRMNADGSQPFQLTNNGGETFPTTSPASEFVVFSARPTDKPLLWKVPFEGGDSIQLTEDQTHWASFSPDGKLIACLMLPENERIKLALFSADTGKLLRSFEPVGSAASPDFPPTFRWTNDSRNIYYVSTVNGVSNLIIQPVDSEKSRKLTDFSTDRIFSFDFSADGKQIVYARGSSRNDIVLFEDFSD
jgi:eukaryotic-like serine/threonine-protein kinase